MRVLSLKQPWAWLVVHGGKTIENRKWKANFRGEFLIHAAKGMTRDEYYGAMAWTVQRGHAIAERVPSVKALERGGIIGIARLVDVIAPDLRADLQGVPCIRPEGHGDWHMHSQWGFVLEDIRPLPFTPCKGSLNFFRASDAVLAQLGLNAQIVSP